MDSSNLKTKDRKIIVGIDFGTTFSGIAWAETMRPEHRDVITIWPTSDDMLEGESSQKVPTRIHYTDDGMEWGFGIPIDCEPNEILDSSTASHHLITCLHAWDRAAGATRAHLPTAKQEPATRPNQYCLCSGDLDPTYSKDDSKASANKKPVDRMITDYLSALGKHLYHILRTKLGDEAVDSIPFEFVITVPAIWTDSAKDRMLKACKKADGLGAKNIPISLVSEPEAAAMFAIDSLDPHGLKTGDSFVVCDAGGGTVDLITYTIKSLEPVLEVKEAAPGDGGLCGSTFLNKRFSDFMTDTLGEEKHFNDDVLAHALQFFENFKRKFPLDVGDRTFPIPVNGMRNNPGLGIRAGWWRVSGEKLKKKVFDPVIQDIVQLVKDQVSTSDVPIKTVLLVGGFGSSVYLRGSIARSLVDEGVTVRSPSYPWTAVARGAVMKGLANNAAGPATVKIVERRARKHYGRELSVPYKEAQHAAIAQTRYWDDKAGCFKVKVMWWLIKRGDLVSENEPFLQHYIKDRLVSSGKFNFINSKVYCDSRSIVAPLQRTVNVVHLCSVGANLFQIPAHEFDKEYGADGKAYYHVSLDLETVFRSASTEYTIIHKGKRYKTVKAEYV